MTFAFGVPSVEFVSPFGSSVVACSGFVSQRIPAKTDFICFYNGTLLKKHQSVLALNYNYLVNPSERREGDAITKQDAACQKIRQKLAKY